MNGFAKTQMREIPVTLLAIGFYLILWGCSCATGSGAQNIDENKSQSNSTRETISSHGGLAVEEGDWSVNGTRLHYRMVGKGEPLFLLHGGPGGNYLTFKHMEGLGDRFRLIMYDQRGSGQSERFSTEKLNQDPSLISVEKHVEDLEAIRKQLGIEKMVLLGHSWGATLAIFYASSYPQHVQKMILMNGGPSWPELTEQQKQNLLKRLSPEVSKEIEQQVKLLSENITKWEQPKLDEWFINLAKLNFSALYCDPQKAPGDEIGRAGFWANFLTNQYEANFDIQEFAKTLSKVDAPTLLITGKCDPNPFLRQTVLRDALPHATMVVFENSGHNPHIEQAELFVKTVRAFMADQPLPLPRYTEKPSIDS